MKSRVKTSHRSAIKFGQKIFEPLIFQNIEKKALSFADHIELNFEKIAEILLDYESFEVVKDEISRTLDLLRNLKENKEYFSLRIGAVAAFLPRNQPLYAFTCFVVIPSLMATEVQFRIPHSMHHFLPRLLKVLKVSKFFPAIFIARKGRLDFLRERSALRIDPKTQESVPVTDVVIFTGTPNHAERLRLVFDSRTLFIANGAGHNPLVVSEDADIPKAVEATLTLQLYNQGQDCAAPNSILVHRKIFRVFHKLLCTELHKVRVGSYKDRSCRVGPISDPEDLVRIQNLLIANKMWLDETTPGLISSRNAIVEPTIICKPLRQGGNFTEVFAPVIFLQEYANDSELCLYFETPQYARNAMYISLFGKSSYIQKIIGKSINGQILHDSTSILQNIHLHMPGIERGTKPYGGYGIGASSVSLNGKVVSKPTLPQRDIYELIVKPLQNDKKYLERRMLLRRATKTVLKNVRKLLALKSREPIFSQIRPTFAEVSYIDSHAVLGEGKRYVRVDSKRVFHLLANQNLEYIATLQPKDFQHVRTLRKFLNTRKKILLDEFTSWLYAIPKQSSFSEQENRDRQLQFFGHVYQLLFGQSAGPRLANFLLDADRTKIHELLDI